MAEKFNAKEVRRNRCLAWDPKANGGKGAGVYTSDLVDDKGNVHAPTCDRFGVAVTAVTYITLDDLNAAYAKGAQAALAFHAKDCDLTPDDLVYKLVLADAMQDAANKSVRDVRPVTDKAKERATHTLRKILEAQGKTPVEITTLLAALSPSA